MKLALALVLSLSNMAAERSALQELERLEHTWSVAHLQGDVEALDALWADDVTITVPGMPLLGKADVLAMWRSRPTTFTRYETSAVVIRLYGDCAVVTGRLQRTRDFSGRVASEDWQFTKVYIRAGRTWRVVSYHASESPK